MEETCKNGVCELYLRIQELPQDNSALVTAGIAFLAVILSGAVSAYVVFITSTRSNENERRNWMDAKLVDFVGELSSLEYNTDSLKDIAILMSSASVLVSRRRIYGDELIRQLDDSTFPSEGDLISWQRELKAVANKYFNA